MKPHMLDLPTCREDMDMRLVAQAMSHVNRYGGRGTFPISIATHSYALATAVPQRLRAAALTHDVPEIWFGEVPSPIKVRCPEYVAAEREFLIRLAGWFDVPLETYEALETFDRAICHDELAAAFPLYEDLGSGLSLGVGRFYVPTDPEKAASRWLDAYHDWV